LNGPTRQPIQRRPVRVGGSEAAVARQRDRGLDEGRALSICTHRGVEIGLHLRPGLSDEDFVAEAIGNLAAFRLQQERGETLGWQVARVEGPGGHHFRLVVRHPERVLDIGFEHDLKRLLDSLSAETVEDLRKGFEVAKREGLKPTRIRHVRESVDFWRDDFWNWLG